MAGRAKREVLLVGSVPLGSAEHVFAACAEALDGQVKRLPDGKFITTRSANGRPSTYSPLPGVTG